MAKTEKVIRLRVGEEYPVELESLLPAGYEWQSEMQGDDAVADVVKADPVGGEPLEAVGVGPNEVFKIKALRPGKARVRFAQRRPWEGDAEPTDEQVVDLLVGE